jgi:hypothetical protein
MSARLQLMPWSSRSGALLAFVASAALSGWMGCDALVGIQEGELAGDSGSDATAHADSGADGPQGSDSGKDSTTDGGGGDGSALDSTTDSTAPDGTTPDAVADAPDATADSYTVDASEAGSTDATTEAQGGDSAADAPTESGTQPPTLGCTIVPGTQTLVQDLSGTSYLEFTGQLRLATRSGNASAYVVAQRQNDSNEFVVYSVDFTTRTSIAAAVTGPGDYLSLLDAISQGSTSQVLAAYGTNGGSTESLEIVPLPYGGGTPGPAWPLPNATVPSGVGGGRLLLGPPDSYLVYAGNNGNTVYALCSGEGMQGGPGAVTTLMQSSSSFLGGIGDNPFVSIGGTDYAFLSLSDGGRPVAVYPADASNSGTTSTFTANASVGALLDVQVDPSNPGNVEAIALNLPDGFTPTLWAGSIPQASLVPMSVGAPQFTQGSVIALGDFPGGGTATTWMGSELLRIGPPGDNSGGVVLLWVGPTGRAVSRATTSGKLVTTSNEIVGAGVQVLDQTGELTATLSIAWVERIVPDAGSAYDQLYAAEVSCVPLPSGD